MPLEDLTGPDKYLGALVPTNPVSDPPDDVTEGAGHIRGIKNVLLNTFGPLDGPLEVDPQAELIRQFIGMIQPFLSLAPQWLACNGQTITAANYPELVEFLNPGGTDAVLPDLRGYFLRGWSDDATVDPEGPRVPGNVQLGELRAHAHPQPDGVNYFVGYVGSAGLGAAAFNNPYGQATATGSAGGAETRPKNTAMVWGMFAGRVAP